MASDITDVLRRNRYYVDDLHGYRHSDPDQLVAALAAAAADGPLVEDVECDGCDGLGNYHDGKDWGPHKDCNGSGTGRIVVHRADPALAEALQREADLVERRRPCERGTIDILRAAARIIGGEQ